MLTKTFHLLSSLSSTGKQRHSAGLRPRSSSHVPPPREKRGKGRRRKKRESCAFFHHFAPFSSQPAFRFFLPPRGLVFSFAACASARPSFTFRDRSGGRGLLSGSTFNSGGRTANGAVESGARDHFFVVSLTAAEFWLTTFSYFFTSSKTNNPQALFLSICDFTREQGERD